MISSILLTIVIILIVSAILFFLFNILFTSLKDQQINANDPLFSKEEVKFTTGSPEFRHINTGNKAVVLCSAKRDSNDKRFKYEGQQDCTLFKSIYGTESFCNEGCSGFGNCVRSCTRHAITIENGTAVINGTCNGCGLCVTVCPKNLIILVPVETKEYVLCKCAEGEKNGCSMCGKKSKIEINIKKDYAFWEKCYRIFSRK